MAAMKQLLIAASTLCLGYGLTACAVTHSPDDDAVERLAKPPRLVSEVPAFSTAAENSEAVTANKGAQELSVDQVFTLEGNPPVLRIKQPVKEAWYSLSLALLQLKLHIGDHNREQGFYFVDYDADHYVEENASALQNVLALFNDQYKEGRYKISIKEQGGDTEITVESVPDIGTASESSESDDGDPEKVGGPEILLKDLYRVLRKDALEEAPKERKSAKPNDDLP
jgi:hypothetical protein